MRRLLILPALLLVGCGGETTQTTTETEIQTQTRTTTAAETTDRPDKPKPSGGGISLDDALATMETQGESAGSIGGSDMDLLPSEKGAKRLIDQGLVDEDAFCKADRATLDAERVVEAEEAFVDGWKSSASGELRDMGSTMYYALGTRCLP